MRKPGHAWQNFDDTQSTGILGQQGSANSMEAIGNTWVRSTDGMLVMIFRSTVLTTENGIPSISSGTGDSNGKATYADIGQGLRVLQFGVVFFNARIFIV